MPLLTGPHLLILPKEVYQPSTLFIPYVFICYVFSLFQFFLRRKSSTVKDAGRPFSSPIFMYTPFKVIWTNGKTCLENANLAGGLSPPLTSWWKRRQLDWAVSSFLLTLLPTSKLEGDSCDRDGEVESGAPSCDPLSVAGEKHTNPVCSLEDSPRWMGCFCMHLQTISFSPLSSFMAFSHCSHMTSYCSTVFKVSFLKRFLLN